MEKLKNNIIGIVSLLGVVGAIGSGFTVYGMFEQRLQTLESRDYVIEQVVDLQPAYDKLDTAKEVLATKISEQGRIWNTDVARLTDSISDNKTNLEVVKKQIELLGLEIDEIKLENDNPLR